MYEQFKRLSSKQMTRVTNIILVAALIEEYGVNDYKYYLEQQINKNAGGVKNILIQLRDLDSSKFEIVVKTMVGEKV